MDALEKKSILASYRARGGETRAEFVERMGLSRWFIDSVLKDERTGRLDRLAGLKKSEPRAEKPTSAKKSEKHAPRAKKPSMGVVKKSSLASAPKIMGKANPLAEGAVDATPATGAVDASPFLKVRAKIAQADTPPASATEVQGPVERIVAATVERVEALTRENKELRDKLLSAQSKYHNLLELLQRLQAVAQ